MKLPDKININKVAAFCQKHAANTKVYIGTDSERIRIKDHWEVDYMTVVIVHMGAKHGGKIFGALTRERDYDKKENKPSYRLMNEVYKTAEVFLELSKLIDNEIEVHLDLNPDESCGSSVCIHQAIGYIKGVCNLHPKVKPEAFAASNAADQLKRIMNY